MNRETIHPASDEHWHALRAQDITSTDVSALFGMSPYKTAFELWHEKASGERAPFVENERVKWGNRLEASIARGIAEDRDWVIRPFKEYMRAPELRAGSSFDFRIIESGAGRAAAYPGIDAPCDAILEIKAVDWLAFRNGWTVEDDFIEAPAHIELQVQHQLLVSGLRRAYIGVLVGGNDIRVIEREADAGVHRAIIERVAAFWDSIARNDPPDPVMPDDAAAVIRMNQTIQPGKLLDARNDETLAGMVREYTQAKSDEKNAKELAESIKAGILQHIGDAEKVLAATAKISAGVVAPSAGTLVTQDMVGSHVGGRAGYRMLRVTQAKPK